MSWESTSCRNVSILADGTNLLELTNLITEEKYKPLTRNRFNPKLRKPERMSVLKLIEKIFYFWPFYWGYMQAF